MEEDRLIKKAKKGEAEAFGLLYDQYLSPIYRYIFLKVDHQRDAEDLTHQVFLQAWQNIKTYQSQGFPFSSWLYRIASNVVIDYYRTKKNYLNLEEVPEENLIENDPPTEKMLDQKIELIRVRKALQKLAPEQQDILIMKFVNELSNQEIAKIIKKNEGTIRVIQHRALKKLKKILASERN